MWVKYLNQQKIFKNLNLQDFKFFFHNIKRKKKLYRKEEKIHTFSGKKYFSMFFPNKEKIYINIEQIWNINRKPTILWIENNESITHYTKFVIVSHLTLTFYQHYSKKKKQYRHSADNYTIWHFLSHVMHAQTNTSQHRCASQLTLRNIFYFPRYVFFGQQKVYPVSLGRKYSTQYIISVKLINRRCHPPANPSAPYIYMKTTSAVGASALKAGWSSWLSAPRRFFFFSLRKPNHMNGAK